MTKKEALERLENTRLALDNLKAFNGKAPMLTKIKNQIHFMKVHKADDIAHLMVKEIETALSTLKNTIPEGREAEIDSVLKTCRGELVLTGAI